MSFLIDPYRFASVVTPVLDIYPNAAVAYSVRLLRTAYTGNAIRVRRSSDNTEQNIGFDANGYLDETALTTFVGANNGFVTTWYDQSGNSRNATQTTASSQPQIVSSGSVIKENNKISIQYDGSNDFLSYFFTSNISQPGTFFVVNKNIVGTGIISSDNNNSRWQIYRTGIAPNNINIFAGSVLAGNNNSANQVLIYALFNGANSSISINNNTAVTGNAGTQQSNALRLGVDSANNYGQNEMQEVILYNSDQSTNKTAILSNINTYYGIY